MSFYEKFLARLREEYPQGTQGVDFSERFAPTLVCPQTISLPASIKRQAEDIAAAFDALRNLPDRSAMLEKIAGVPDPGNASALMSFDFHIDSENQLRLIEINTNASMGLITDTLYRTHGIENGFCSDFRKEIIATFKSELKAAGITNPTRATVVDENPTAQRMYLEFLLYRELFTREGWQTAIRDPQEFTFEAGKLRTEDGVVDLVYNRVTDFYLKDKRNSALRQAMLAQAACLSPHPHEYLLLADKERLLELSQPGAIDSLPLSEEHREVIRKTLIKTVEVSSFESADALWAERKRWFFKTKQSFGGKAAYRGTSISRQTFANVFSQGDYLAQENIPAPTVTIPTEEGSKEFKYDLRFFSYRSHIQLACARLYQGQMTNSQTPGGGVTAISWT